MSKKYSSELIAAAKHYQSNVDYFDEGLLDPDDIYLASFPRSGNHYVRFTILSALYFKETGSFPDDFSELGKLPDIHRPDLDHAFPYKPKIIKTHYSYDPRYRKVIHLLRDPRDVIVSYYHYTYGSGAHYFKCPAGQPSLPDFVKHFLSGNVWPGKLRSHTRSYDDAVKKGSARYIKFHYENIVKDPLSEFSRMLKFLEIALSDNELSELVRHTSFENMSTLFEARTAQKGAGFNKKESITRKGGSGGYMDELDRDSILRIEQSFGEYNPVSK